MLLNEIINEVGMTKRAVKYYEEKGLLSVDKDNNGYRNYTAQDVETLKKISVYRKLGISIKDIQSLLETGDKSILLRIYQEKVQEKVLKDSELEAFPALAVSYYSNKKGLKAELGSDRLLGVPLETYIPSEKLAIESGSADENIEIMKAYMCEQRGIRLIKLPMKGTELDYADSLKRAFQNVHIFISSDTEEDVEIIKKYI